MRWMGHVAHMNDRRGAYRVLVWRHVSKRTLARPKRRWKDNNKMDIQEVEWQTWNLFIWLRIIRGSRIM